jgi:hypothetical protein
MTVTGSISLSQSMAESGACAVAVPDQSSAARRASVDLKDDILPDLGLRRAEIRTEKRPQISIAHEGDKAQNCKVKQPFDEAKHDVACRFQG